MSLTTAEFKRHVEELSREHEAEIYYAYRDALIAHNNEQQAELERLRALLRQRSRIGDEDRTLACWEIPT